MMADGFNQVGAGFFGGSVAMVDGEAGWGGTSCTALTYVHIFYSILNALVDLPTQAIVPLGCSTKWFLEGICDKLSLDM